MKQTETLSSPQLKVLLPFKTAFRDAAVRKMARLILFKTFLPLAVLTWVTTKSWVLVALSVISMPCWVMLQSAVGLLTYRLYYANSPKPLTPRHGVVVVNPKDNKPTLKERKPLCSYRRRNNSTLVMDSFYEIPYDIVPSSGNNLDRAVAQKPLRLLVIGDSLAIGVGQTHWPTPIMPETIAKSLSKRMNGRPVYWTCHGATGASLGWVIRELERGVDYLGSNSRNSGSKNATIDPEKTFVDRQLYFDDHDTGESTSGDDSSKTEEELEQGLHSLLSNGLVKGSDTVNLEPWRRGLCGHRKRFEPDLQGHYDIAIVFTGPNDLKTSILPFLATGEDSQFRKQAQERGSSFSNDLHLLLETLSRKMKKRIQHIRDSVEAATETVRERMEVTLEKIAPESMKSRFQSHSQQNAQVMLGHDEEESMSRCNLEVKKLSEDDDANISNLVDELTDDEFERQDRPLVVLPGMAANTLPIFQHEPIKWYAPAAVDIMDMHKKDVAHALPQDILYVPAPTETDMTDYILEQGPIYAEKQSEDVWLSLRDISNHDSHWQQARMRSYYQIRGQSAYLNNPFKAIGTRCFGIAPPIHLKAFAVDGIHPNELGYDFWGRYLADAIFEEWQRTRASSNHGDGGSLF